jgi:hypothetical protein
MEGAVTVVAAEAAMSEDSPEMDILVVIEDSANIHHQTVWAFMAGEDIEIVIVEDITADISEVMLQGILMEVTTIAEAITEVIAGTIIEDMLHAEQPSGFFLVGWLLAACIVHSGGLITPYR